MSTLLVPIRVDALRLCEDFHGVLSPLADFSGLPWSDPNAEGGRRDIHPDIAFTSQNVLADPFSDTYGSLERGIHLHWALPDALTVGRHPKTDGKPDQNQVEFPHVPNRWLVVRNGGGSPEGRWVVESDYLWPEGEPWAPGRVTYPVARRKEGSDLIDESRQPYRYLGRSWKAADWSEQKDSEHLHHLEKLVAVGYGEPTFAAFYPNCRGVFGFHDTCEDDEQRLLGELPEGLTYEVFGWYSDTNNDLLHRLRDEWDAMIGRLNKEWTKKEGLDLEKLQQARLKKEAIKELGWEWDHSRSEPDEMLCYGRVVFSEHASGPGVPNPQQRVRISIGNTGTEALSAYLSGEIALKERERLKPDGAKLDAIRRRIEHQLEALHLSEATKGQRLDLGPKFKEARHGKSFHAVSGGTIWTLKPRAVRIKPNKNGAEFSPPHADPDTPATKPSSEGSMAALPNEVATVLHEINQLQGRLDRANAEIVSLRKQIFSEWHKYITCCYRPDYARHDYPSIDAVKLHVEGLIALLDVKKAYVGDTDPKQSVTSSSLLKKLDALAAHGIQRMTFRTEDEFRAWCEKMAADTRDFVPLVVQLATQIGRATAMLTLLTPIGVAARTLVAVIEAVLHPKDSTSSNTTERPDPLTVLPALLKDLGDKLDGLAKNPELGPIYSGAIASLQKKVIELTKNPKLDPSDLSLLAPFVAIPDVELARGAAPRYWQPNDPVLLLAGDGVKRGDRHGEDGRLDCYLVEVSSIQDLPNKLPSFDDELDKTLKTDVRGEGATRTTNGDPWHPLFFEWDVAIEPYEGNVPSDRRIYPPDFVEKNFILRERRCEFLTSHGLDASKILSNSFLSGRSILTAHGGTILGRQIDDYLLHQVELYLRRPTPPGATQEATRRDDNEKILLAPPSDEPNDRKDRYEALDKYLADKAKKEAFVKWCDEGYRRALVDVYVHAPALTRSDSAATEPKHRKLLEHPPGPKDRLTFFNQHKNDILAWFNNRVPDSAHADAPVHIVLAAREQLSSVSDKIQSQALGGFHEALLMQKEVLQFDSVDPLGFAEYREFTERTVRKAVTGHSHTAPLPHFDFHPIRSGQMKLASARLVDTFGRVAPLSTELHATQQMKTDRDNAAGLPPRITQPARVNFRWLSAADDALECNSHPLTSPICGWVVPNNLDRSLMIYDGAGALLGYVDRNGRWRSAPGRPGPVLTADIDNLHLSRMVTWLGDNGREQPAFINDFIDVLDSALENIDPEGFEQHEARALLMGRPLALVRASVNLELLGLPACDQSWDALQQALAGHEFDTDGFLDVRFPVRIGEHKQLNDGVAGFWIDTADGYREDRFYAPQSEWAERLEGESNLVIDHVIGKPLDFSQPLADPPHQVSILLDPRGVVHCTTGVLPTKALRIPQEHYAEALKALRVTFLTSPLLTPPGRTEIPLPAEPGWTWSWLQRDGAGWTERSTDPVIERDEFVAAAGDGLSVWLALLEFNWLKAIDDGRSEAQIQSPDDRRTLPAALQPRCREIESVLAGVETITRARFVEAIGHGVAVWQGLLASAWLEPLDAAGTRARLAPPARRKNLLDELVPREAEIRRLLDVLAHALAPARLEARFGPAAEIREGWLQLTPKNES